MYKVVDVKTGMLISEVECWLELMILEEDVLIPAGIDYVVGGEDEYVIMGKEYEY